MQAKRTNSEEKALAYAKKGIVMALLSGIIYSLDGLIITKSEGFSPFNNPAFLLLAPLICAGVHDFCSALVTTFINYRNGRLRDIGRSLASKPGRPVILGALIGSAVGLGGYMGALKLVGPAYTLPITSLYPAAAAVLAVFVLKENIPLRSWTGLALCICGAVLIGYTPPSAGLDPSFFYWGLLLASMGALGWGAEAVLTAAGMDFIEPIVALNIYYIVSSVLYLCCIIPLAVAFIPFEAGAADVVGQFLQSPGMLFIVLAGVVGAAAYICWYMAMNMAGVSRAMALNISYVLWGIVFSALFTEVEITKTLIIGAAVIMAGMLLVIGNPKDMMNLRKAE